MAMTPEQRSAYVAQQMSQFQGKRLRSVFSKGWAGVDVTPSPKDSLQSKRWLRWS